ncbi:MAG: tyrosine-type recombinase/integrase [Pseudomonadota bacterium]
MSHRDEDDTGAASLFDAYGQRKYLVAREARQLRDAAAMADRETRLFCELLRYTGCRISEGLAVTPRRLDVKAGFIVFRTLKRRKRTYRAVPVPHRFMRELCANADASAPDEPIFRWSRTTAWRRIKSLMQQAGIEGPQATAKGLRHLFGVHGISSKIPESAMQRWLGHARPRSTRVYTFAMGTEERALARRMWR